MSYSFDPKQISLPSNPATPQGGANNALPDSVPLAAAPSSGGSANPAGVPPATDAPNNGSPRRLATGTILSGGRYKIEAPIAAGGMGAVYRALDTRFNRPCAVKEMLDTFSNEGERKQAIEWFSREATLLLDLNHPCIPRVRDFFDESGRNYLVMDFIDGYTLAQMLEREENVLGANGARGVTEARARSWARQVCGVLNYLHHLSPPIIFRDLKPSNIMITQRDEIKLIDFGIARTFQTQNQSTVIMTLGYAPPEQLHGMPEPRSDLYALGATIFRVLTRHDAANNKPNIFAFPPLRSLRPDISVAFEQVIMKALAPNLEQRWSSAEEMERALINLPPVVASPAAGQIVSSASLPTQLAGAQPVSGPGSGQPPLSTQHVSGANMPPSGSPLTRGTTTGPAGSYLMAALGHLTAVPPRLDAAYDAVRTAHSLEPNNSLVHKTFGQIFARRIPANPDQAMQAYNRSLQLFYDDAETHKLVGDVLFYVRPNYIQAIAAYTQALRLNPNDFEAHERLGLCFEKTGQLDAALREYQEAVRLASGPPAQPVPVMLRLNYALGMLAKRLNHFPAAEHALVQVLILNPSDHQTRFLLSEVYEREGKLEEAFRECGYVIGPLGNNPQVTQLYSRLRSHLGR